MTSGKILSQCAMNESWPRFYSSPTDLIKNFGPVLKIFLKRLATLLIFCMYKMNYPSHGMVTYEHWGWMFPEVSFEVLFMSDLTNIFKNIFLRKKCDSRVDVEMKCWFFKDSAPVCNEWILTSFLFYPYRLLLLRHSRSKPH